MPSNLALGWFSISKSATFIENEVFFHLEQGEICLDLLLTGYP